MYVGVIVKIEEVELGAALMSPRLKAQASALGLRLRGWSAYYSQKISLLGYEAC